MRIGFIGNFEPPFSTENDRKWSFLSLGHDVVTFQENKTTIEDLDRHFNGVDVFLYSHTHGWEIPGLKDFFLDCKGYKPTASVHLDRWAWLEREKDVGKEASWFTEYMFMADGSPEAIEMYNKLRTNVYWLKPGVVARDCYLSAPDPVRFPYRIVFVGSRNYHKEYPFRKQLIDFLEKEYPDDFMLYDGGVRGHDLNTLLITADIVVGDSCFGGRPQYVSDRYYETRGRGGFLLHPHVEGVDTEGVVDYKGLPDLKEKIDYYLDHEEEREELRVKGFLHVRNNETYSHRALEILEVLNEKSQD